MPSRILHSSIAILAGLIFAGCQHTTDAPRAARHASSYSSFGSIERLDPRLDALIPPGATIEKLASGFDWSEGPVWMKSGRYLLFSDVPSNTVYRWKEGEGISVYLRPSGYTGSIPRGGEPGSNGLTVDAQGRLILCQHGDRRVVRWERNRGFAMLADRFNGQRFNSPNDVVLKSNGDFYFTDPPYGLEGNVNDPKKEIPFQGVYRVTPSGQVSLLTSELSRPNGLAFSPDEKTLYVAVSDPQRAIWMAYSVNADGTLGAGRVLFDATSLVGPAHPGLPDGLKVDRTGHIFATGPGGVFIFAPDGTHLGTINTGEATANCGWGDDGSTLYITADMHLARVKTRTRGARF